MWRGFPSIFQRFFRKTLSRPIQKDIFTPKTTTIFRPCGGKKWVSQILPSVTQLDPPKWNCHQVAPQKRSLFFKPPFLKVTKTEETGPKILSFVEASDFRPYVLKPSPDGGFGVLPILLGMAFWGHKNHVMKCQELNSWMKDQRNISKQVFVWWNLAVKSLDLCLVKLLALLDHVHPGNQKFQDITGNQTPFPNQPSGCFQK